MNTLLFFPPLLGFSMEFWARFAEIVFGTIFSIALLWVVMQIWKKSDEEEKNDPTDQEK